MLKLATAKRQEGATLLELVMFIGLAALILISAIVWYITASEGQRVQEEVSNLNALTSLTRNLFSTQGTYAGLANGVVTPSAQFPEKMRVAGNANLIRNGWIDNGVTLTPVDLNADAVLESFRITYTNVPQGACVDFVSRVFRYYTTVTVNGNAVASVPDATLRCNAALTNTVVFTAR